MLSFSARWLLPAGLFLSVPLVQAQSDPGVGVPSSRLQYHSALEKYRKFDEQPVAPWRETNDTVGTIGGWRTYAREARPSEPAGNNLAPTPNDKGAKGDASKSATSKAMPESHSGHGVKP